MGPPMLPSKSCQISLSKSEIEILIRSIDRDIEGYIKQLPFIAIHSSSLIPTFRNRVNELRDLKLKLESYL